jgi:murein DD-endopeptidase MepM/ murein hydrolase activator NlpD
MNRHSSTIRVTILALIVALVTSHVAPAGAAGVDPEREDARRRKASLQSDLDVLTASETDLQAALGALSAGVLVQTAAVDEAKGAAAAAETDVAELEAELAVTGSAISDLKADLVTRAVDTFVRPSELSFVEVVESSDPAEAERKQAFLDLLMAHDTDVVGQLQRAEEELTRQRGEAEAAREAAEALRAGAEAALVELEQSMTDHAALKAGIEVRQAEVLAEIEQLAAAEAELGALIDSRVAAAGTGAPGEPVAAASGAGAASGGGCVWPARGSVTSEFGSRWGRLHAGLDIAAPIGTPIWAAKAGTVAVAGTQNGYGTTVVLDHGGGMTTLYGHQSRLAVSVGQSVSQGQVIGYVGNTGRSTGPHLHFETRYGGSPRSPRGCLG